MEKRTGRRETKDLPSTPYQSEPGRTCIQTLTYRCPFPIARNLAAQMFQCGVPAPRPPNQTEPDSLYIQVLLYYCAPPIRRNLAVHIFDCSVLTPTWSPIYSDIIVLLSTPYRTEPDRLNV